MLEMFSSGAMTLIDLMIWIRHEAGFRFKIHIPWKGVPLLQIIQQTLEVKTQLHYYYYSYYYYYIYSKQW
jgi:hypothetical protein